MKKFILVSLSFLFSVGCISKEYEYKFISLENIDGIDVVSYGRSEVPGIESDREMPIRYELSREKYILIFELDRKNYWPSVFVASRLPNGNPLVIEPLFAGECGSFDDLGIDYRIDEWPAMRYVWSPGFHQGCKVGGNESYPAQQLIAFRVKNQDGDVLGKETIPFVLRKNGTYRVKDGI